MPTLYGTRGSGSASVEAALAIAGVPCETVDAASWEPGPGLDALRRVNPIGQIPTLVLDDGTVMSESAAILIHLGLAHPASGLLPQDPSRRAHCLRGLVYVAANCYAAIGIIDYPERFTTDASEAATDAIRAGTRKRLHELWDLFADAFPASPFLSGERIGALDVLAATVSKWSGARKHLAASRPAFSAALSRIEADPRVAEVFARHWPPQP